MANQTSTQAEPMKAFMDAQQAMFAGFGDPAQTAHKHFAANAEAASKIATVWTDVFARIGRDTADAVKAEADRAARVTGEFAQVKDVGAAMDVATRHVREAGEARMDCAKRAAEAVTDGAESAGRAVTERLRAA